MRRAIEAFGSGVVVYMIVAACGSGGSGGGAFDASVGAASGSGGTSAWDALFEGASWDAVSDPVTEADAAPLPLVKEVPCDIPYTYFNSTYYFAEVPFPGMTQQQLSLARVYLRPSQPPDLPIAGYEWAAAPDFFVKDGSVLVFCRLTFFNQQGLTARVALPG
jgi:hypothetical protein